MLVVDVKFYKEKHNMEKQTFVIEFDQDQLNVILGALAELPFKVAQPLINKIVEDFNKQAMRPTEYDIMPKAEKVKAEAVN